MAITVIVAAKNEAASIRSCLESLRSSLGPNDDIIVVDDGSTDGTGEIASSVQGMNISVLRNEDSVGRATARNMAVEASQGEFLAIQDADDLALPSRFEPARLLERDRDLVAVSGQCLTVTPRGRFWDNASYPLDSAAISDGLQAGIATLCHTGSIIRRSAFESVGGYDADYPRAQDLNLFRRLDAVGPMRNVEVPVVVYRHGVVLSWSVWSQTREMRQKMVGVEYSQVRSRAVYPLAQARRVWKFASTTRSATRFANEVWGSA